MNNMGFAEISISSYFKDIFTSWEPNWCQPGAT